MLGDLLRRTQISRHLALWRRSETPRTTPYFAAEAKRQASLPPIEPPMSFPEPALAAYARSVVSLAGLCEAHGIMPLFATQPTMLTRAPGASELAVVWGLNNGTHSVVPAHFVDLLDTINQRLLATCAERGYACVDLAAVIPRGLHCFYDQVHFNEPDAKTVAEALLPRVRELLAQRPSRR